MDRHAGEIIEGIYASTEGADDVALVNHVLDEVREELAKACEAYALAYPDDKSYRRACHSCATMIRGRMSSATTD